VINDFADANRASASEGFRGRRFLVKLDVGRIEFFGLHLEFLLDGEGEGEGEDEGEVMARRG
jgi:hypothetical protein